MTASDTVRLVLDTKATLGEGPIWDSSAQLLFWVDILKHKVHVYDPAEHRDRVIDVGQDVGTIVSRRSGGVMLALHGGFASMDIETGAVRMITDPEVHLPGNRFNDGKCDPAGRLWAGTMAYTDQDTQGSLYCLDTDLGVRRVLSGLGISNGIAWSLDGKTMYFIDSLEYAVKAFDYEKASGAITNGRFVIRVPKRLGMPDGMTIDAEGMLWIGLWQGACVGRWNPNTGESLQTIRLPATNVTACAFGSRDLDTLYITTATAELSPAQLVREPLAGGLFAVKPGVKGTTAFAFDG